MPHKETLKFSISVVKTYNVHSIDERSLIFSHKKDLLYAVCIIRLAYKDFFNIQLHKEEIFKQLFTFSKLL